LVDTQSVLVIDDNLLSAFQSVLSNYEANRRFNCVLRWVLLCRQTIGQDRRNDHEQKGWPKLLMHLHTSVCTGFGAHVDFRSIRVTSDWSGTGTGRQ
jgi:hypothetical protein